MFDFLLHSMAAGAVWMTKEVIGRAMASTTSVDLDSSGWFSGVVHQLMPVDELVVAPLLFAATLGAVLRQDMRRLARAWGACLPLALLGGFAAVELTNLGLQFTNALSTAVQYEVSPDLETVYLKVITAGFNLSLGAGPAAGLLVLVFLGGVLAIWLELALRSAAIELAVLFMPFALAGMIWPATAHWAKRLLELLGALLLTKPVIVGALCLGSRTRSRWGTARATSSQPSPSCSWRPLPRWPCSSWCQWSRFPPSPTCRGSPASRSTRQSAPRKECWPRSQRHEPRPPWAPPAAPPATR